MQTELVGVYRAIVTSTADPTGSGKVRTQCPQVAGSAEIRWAEPVNPAEPVPDVGSIIWVAFSGGDITKPMYFNNKTPTIAPVPTVDAGLPVSPTVGQLAFETTTNTLQVWTGTQWRIESGYTSGTFTTGVGQSNYLTLASPVAFTSNTTLTNVTGFSFPVVANGRYIFEGHLAYMGDIPGIPGDLKIDWTVPASTDFKWARNAYPVNNTSQIDIVETNESTIRVIGTYGTSTRLAAQIKGNIVVSATPGTIQMRAAQNTSNVTPTTLLTSSWIRVTRLS